MCFSSITFVLAIGVCDARANLQDEIDLAKKESGGIELEKPSCAPTGGWGKGSFDTIHRAAAALGANGSENVREDFFFSERVRGLSAARDIRAGEVFYTFPRRAALHASRYDHCEPDIHLAMTYLEVATCILKLPPLELALARAVIDAFLAPEAFAKGAHSPSLPPHATNSNFSKLCAAFAPDVHAHKKFYARELKSCWKRHHPDVRIKLNDIRWAAYHADSNAMTEIDGERDMYAIVFCGMNDAGPHRESLNVGVEHVHTGGALATCEGCADSASHCQGCTSSLKKMLRSQPRLPSPTRGADYVRLRALRDINQGEQLFNSIGLENSIHVKSWGAFGPHVEEFCARGFFIQDTPIVINLQIRSSPICSKLGKQLSNCPSVTLPPKYMDAGALTCIQHCIQGGHLSATGLLSLLCRAELDRIHNLVSPDVMASPDTPAVLLQAHEMLRECAENNVEPTTEIEKLQKYEL